MKANANPEEEYTMLGEIEHVYTRPDMYVGSMEPEQKTQKVIIFEPNGKYRIEDKEILYIEGLRRIFLEILSNAADNAPKSRQLGIAPGVIKVVITPTTVTITNGGRPISCQWHSKHDMWIPEMIFSNLRAGSNFDDTQARKWAGRNGLGAKLAAIFSKSFTLDLVNTTEGIAYKQIFRDRLSVVEPPQRKDIAKKGLSSTSISYNVDFKRFYCETNVEVAHTTRLVKNPDGTQTMVHAQPLTKDPLHCVTCWDHCNGDVTHGIYSDDFIGMMACLSLDFAFNCNVPIEFTYKDRVLNFDVSSPLEFARIYMPEINNIKTRPIVFEDADTRLVLLDTPYNGQKISFANGMPTSQGGVHVNDWINGISKNLKDVLEKDTGVKLTVSDISKHVTIFLSFYVENPRYDGQTKERLKGPKPKVTINNNMLEIFNSWEAVAAIKASAEKRKTNKIAKATDGTKSSYVAVPNSDDAGWAGTKQSHLCTAYLVEGLSAKPFWTNGLKHVPNARNILGCYPLRGKVLNTRKADIETIINNKVMTNIKKFLGLKENMDYSIEKNRLTLRYGHCCIMADADPDGSHIKGLIISNFGAYKGLLESGFVTAHLTPVMLVNKGRVKNKFYSIGEFEKWKVRTPEWNTFTVEYFKGLGSATDGMISDAWTNPVMQKFQCSQDDQDVLELAFGSNTPEARRQLYRMLVKLSDKDRMDSRRITKVEDLIYDELILYAIMANKRHIPRMSDGLKDSFRKVVFTARKVSATKMQGVEEFQAEVKKLTHYRHGPESLKHVVIGMGMDYPGSNNLPLIEKQGNFGSRIGLGKDASAARYLHCRPSAIIPFIFRVEDDVLLVPEMEENHITGVETYYPIIPLQLVNQCDGMGWGWSTNSPNYNPRQIIEFIRYFIQHMKDGKPDSEFDPPQLIPWWRGYNSEMFRRKDNKIMNRGDWDDRGNVCIIKEIPIVTSAVKYEGYLTKWVEEQRISSWKPLHTDANKPSYKIEGYKETFKKHNDLQLEKVISESNMVFMDHECLPRHYCYGPNQVAAQFCKIRYYKYGERKKLYIIKLEADLAIIRLKLLFVEDVIADRLVIKDRPKAEIRNYLTAHNYPETFMAMSMWSITKEKADKLRKEILALELEIQRYREVHPGDLWITELKELDDKMEEMYPGQWDFAEGYGKIQRRNGK